MSTDRIATLKQSGFFAGLSTEDLASLVSRCRWRTTRSGELIIGHRDQSRDVLFLVSGLVRVTVYSVTGRQVTFRDIRPGDVFGELSAIDGKPRSASVESLMPSTLMVVPQAVFLDMLQAHPSVMIETLCRLTALIRSLTDRVVEISTLAVRNRVQAELVRLARDHGGPDAVIRPAPTHAEIASRISTHREAVTRELSRLEDLGLIAREGRTLRVTNLQRLADMVEEVTPE
jgi:CRP/FNR family transcriptional regulator, cyclic AMP receptor protein